MKKIKYVPLIDDTSSFRTEFYTLTKVIGITQESISNYLGISSSALSTALRKQPAEMTKVELSKLRFFLFTFPFEQYSEYCLVEDTRNKLFKEVTKEENKRMKKTNFLVDKKGKARSRLYSKIK